MLPGPSLSSLVSVCVSGSFFWTSALRGPETSFRSSSGSHMSSFPTREDELSPHHLPPFAPSLCLSRLKKYIYICEQRFQLSRLSSCSYELGQEGCLFEASLCQAATPRSVSLAEETEVTDEAAPSQTSSWRGWWRVLPTGG